MLMNNATPTVMWKINSGHLLPNLNSYTLSLNYLQNKKIAANFRQKSRLWVDRGIGGLGLSCYFGCPLLPLFAGPQGGRFSPAPDNSHPAKKRKNNAITNPNLHTPFDSDPSWRAHSAHHTPNKFGARYTAGRKRKGSRGVHMELMEGCFYFPLLSSPLLPFPFTLPPSLPPMSFPAPPLPYCFPSSPLLLGG